MKYKIVIEENENAVSIKRFERKVNMALAAGWEPQGGIFIDSFWASRYGNSERIEFYYQAMIK